MAMQVLVVEDNLEFREEFARFLRRVLQANVRTARNGREAMDLLKSEPADLVVTDVEMPVMNGIDLVAEIRRCQTSQIFIVVMSGGVRLSDTDLKSIGADFFFSKPIDTKTFLQTVRSAFVRAG